MATGTISHAKNIVRVIATGDLVGRTQLVNRNDSLTFTNGVASKDISSIYNGNAGFGFFVFPYNANTIGVMWITLANGVAYFNTGSNVMNGDYYVNYVIFLPTVT